RAEPVEEEVVVACVDPLAEDDAAVVADLSGLGCAGVLAQAELVVGVGDRAGADSVCLCEALVAEAERGVPCGGDRAGLVEQVVAGAAEDAWGGGLAAVGVEAVAAVGQLVRVVIRVAGGAAGGGL